MKNVILTIIFVIISALSVAILFSDVFKIISLSNLEFLSIAFLGITNAFVYSELLFNRKKRADENNEEL
jgi:hypothetical protein